MKALSILSLVLLAAPEKDAAERLRVAWASQYEWREDGIENATLDFHYTYRWQSRANEEQASASEGHGQIVVVGRKIARQQYPAAEQGRGREISSHLEWVVRRFARAPFEEQFKDVTFDGPEPAGKELERITVVGKKSRFGYLLKGDRLDALEWRPGTPPLQYKVGDLGGGYAILGEESSFDLGERGKTVTKRTLTTAKGKGAPYPDRYRYVLETPAGVVTIELKFEPPVFNAEHPVVGDPAARDLLEDAWAHRYALPHDLRLEASFQRSIDNDLGEAYWYRTVKGKLQIWGLDDIQFMLDEGVIPGRNSTYLLKQRLQAHFEWIVWLLGERKFDKEFEGCGFALAPDDDPDDDTQVVELIGHPRVLAYRVEKGRITGYLENAKEKDLWWNFRLKKVKDDLARIESLTVETGGERRKLDIRYSRKGGVEVPVGFEAIGRGYRSGDDRCGVAKFRLKRVKVSRPG